MVNICQAHHFEDKIRTQDVILEEQINFNALLLSEETLSGLHNNGFRVPSPIQVKAIPIGRCGFDLIVKSKSGTGKTVVFSVIALELINVSKNCIQVLILSPTREVAIQIQQVLKSLGSRFKDLRVESFIGGLPIDDDKKKLDKCHIAVGAPGRIKHLIQLGALKCHKVKLFVLDEADKLINSDMKLDVDYVTKTLSSTRQVIASSATYSEDVITYLESIMSVPTFVEPNTDTPLLLGLKQFVSVVKSNLNVTHQVNIKNVELARLISEISFSQCLVFTNYQARVESISNTLNRKGWNSMYISGGQTQTERLNAINLLKEGKCRILLSTDVTARGIDVANIDLVINYDVPYDASTYLHRMGRAGRFGSRGVCITIAAQGEDLNKYCKILGTIGGTSLFVPLLPTEGDLPSDLWNADNSCFELVQGVPNENTNTNSKSEIVKSITNLKLQKINTTKNKLNVKGKVNENTEVYCDNIGDKKSIEDTFEASNADDETTKQILNQSIDVDMPIIETLLSNNKKKEDFKVKLVKGNALSLLQNLVTEQEIPSTSDTNILPQENPLQLPTEGDLLSDLWNADNSCFELVQGVPNENTNTNSKSEIVKSITNLKLQNINTKKNKSNVKSEMNVNTEVDCDNKGDEKNVEDTFETCNANDETNKQILNPTIDIGMPIIETLLKSNIKKEDFKAKLVKENSLSVLQNLVKEHEIPSTSDSSILSQENLMTDAALEMSASKKRKRPIDSTVIQTDDSDEKYQHSETETKDEVIPALHGHLQAVNAYRFDQIFTAHSKEHILNKIANEDTKNLLDELIPVQHKTTPVENVDNSCNGDLEDIFKLSYDYAINCGEKHWLDVLGEELLEKMSLTEKLTDKDHRHSFSDADGFLLEVPKRRKQKKAHRKKTFKDFTQRNKKNKSDFVNDQSMETHDCQDVEQTENQQDQSYYYQAGLYSDYEYAANEHFTSSFDHYSDALTQTLQSFEDLQSFESWFAQWQWQVQGVRDYVQQNIYLQEMSRYAYNKHL